MVGETRPADVHPSSAAGADPPGAPQAAPRDDTGDNIQRQAFPKRVRFAVTIPVEVSKGSWSRRRLVLRILHPRDWAGCVIPKALLTLSRSKEKKGLP